MILNDSQIKKLALEGMIQPCVLGSVREVEITGNSMTSTRKIMSYGVSSYGYDLRLSSKDFKVFRRIPGEVVNPKRFNVETLESVGLNSDRDGDFFTLPAHGYGLGFTLERLSLPRNVTALFIGKSSYARVGAIANCTPGEAGWIGHLTLEISNSSDADIRLYANEGIVQALFFEGEPCETSYADRGGKYQGQGKQIVMAKV